MAKREEFIVDEELIRDMMRGNVPVTGSINDATKGGAYGIVEGPSDPAPVFRQEEPSAVELKRIYPKRKKKEETGGYADRFFVNDKGRNRVTQKISGELYDRIRRFLPVIAPNVNLTSYLNNIISDHLDQNWDEITDLYNKEINKPL